MARLRWQADREVQPLGTALQPAEAPEQPLLPAASQLADAQQPGSPGSQAEQLQAPRADGVVQYRYNGATGLLVPEGAKTSQADSIHAGSRHAVVYIENAVTGGFHRLQPQSSLFKPLDAWSSRRAVAHLSAPGAADAAQNGGLGSSNHHLLGTAGVVALSEVAHSAAIVSHSLAALAQGLLAGVALLHLAFLWAPSGWHSLSGTYMQTWATAAYTLHQIYFVLVTLALVLAWSRLSSLARESKQGSGVQLALPAATVVLLLVTFICTVVSGPFKDKLQAQVAVSQIRGQVVPWHWVDLAAAVCSLLAWAVVCYGSSTYTGKPQMTSIRDTTVQL